MGKLEFYFDQLLRRLWFLPAMFSIAAVATVMLAFLAARFAPDTLPFVVPAEGVLSILTILASSLLSVAVFSLSTMTSAIATASATTTPRAVSLIVGDRRAQTSISIFIGAFLFAVVAIIGLSAQVYSDTGRLVLFCVTLAVVALVVTALIQWVGQISVIGRVDETIDRVEAATLEAFKDADSPRSFGCAQAMDADAVNQRYPIAVHADSIGYVQHLDPEALQRLADDRNLHIFVEARPGSYVDTSHPLVLLDAEVDADAIEAVRDAFVVGHARAFDLDPRFGLIVLNEIAIKALSPAVNDPGTAVDVIGTLVRVLNGWQQSVPDTEVRFDRVSLSALGPNDIIVDAFRPIARDGARQIEVVLRLLSGLETLAKAHGALAPAARAMRLSVIERAEAALTASDDLAALSVAARAFQ